MTSSPISPSGSTSPGLRVDDLGQEVVVVDVQPGLGLDAFARHAGADDLAQAVDVAAP